MAAEKDDHTQPEETKETPKPQQAVSADSRKPYCKPALKKYAQIERITFS